MKNQTKTKDWVVEAYGVFIPFSTKEIAEQAKKELRDEGIPYDTIVIHLEEC